MHFAKAFQSGATRSESDALGHGWQLFGVRRVGRSIPRGATVATGAGNSLEDLGELGRVLDLPF
jgi:hypothetical protein